MLKHIDELAEIWADEIQRILEKSCISYPKASTIARINEGGSFKPGSLCPEVILSMRASAFDVCYKEMRNRWKKIVFKRYIQREKLSRNEYKILDYIHDHVHENLKNHKRGDRVA